MFQVGELRLGAGEALSPCCEGVIPIVASGSVTLDRGMEVDHGAGHGITGRIGIKAAIDLVRLSEEVREPGGARPGAGGRDAAKVWMDGPAADGVNSGLTEDDCLAACRADGKEAEIFSRAGCHAAPGA